MNKKEPTFPQTNEYGGREPGLTKREYFLAAALSGILANPNTTGNADDLVCDIELMVDTLLEKL